MNNHLMRILRALEEIKRTVVSRNQKALRVDDYISVLSWVDAAHRALAAVMIEVDVDYFEEAIQREIEKI